MKPGWLLRLSVRLAVVGGVAVVVWLAHQALTKEWERERRIAQRVTLLDNPRPPPPPKVEQKPVEVKELKQLDIPSVVSQAPPGPQAPSNSLGLDVVGIGGSDAFGLQGNPGGRDITTIGSDKSGGGGTGIAPDWGWYGGIVKRHFETILQSDERLQGHAFVVMLRLWISPDGRTGNVDMVGSTGDAEIDQVVKDVLAGAPPLRQPPPSDMPQPVRVRITARLAG
jgi:protein TonB